MWGQSCTVIRIKKELGASEVDDNIDSGSEVDFDEDVDDSTGEDGATHEFNIERTFELIFRNGLIMRLQVR